MKSFCDYLGLSNSCSYDVDDVIGRADRFGFQNFCSPVADVTSLRPKKKIPVFPLTRMTLFFCADPAIFIAFQKKIKRLSYLPTLKCFRKLDKKLKKCQNCKINA